MADWQKVWEKPQFWDKFDGCPLWMAITRALEVQLTWILSLWQVFPRNGTSEPFFTKRRHYFGFPCFCFHCQDFGRFLLKTGSAWGVLGKVWRNHFIPYSSHSSILEDDFYNIPIFQVVYRDKPCVVVHNLDWMLDFYFLGQRTSIEV